MASLGSFTYGDFGLVTRAVGTGGKLAGEGRHGRNVGERGATGGGLAVRVPN
jgi:hypothetical protein